MVIGDIKIKVRLDEESKELLSAFTKALEKIESDPELMGLLQKVIKIHVEKKETTE